MSDYNKFSPKKLSTNDCNNGIERKPTLVKQTINLETHTVCSESPTILITNYSNKNFKASSSSASINPNPNGSITIYRHKASDMENMTNMPKPSINILINNHFDDDMLPELNIKNEKFIDSSTNFDKITNNKFMIDDDVLVKHKDGRLYLGTIVELNEDDTECLVKYDDDSVRWTTILLVTKFNSTELELSICIICKDGSDPDIPVRKCTQCCRTFHKICMEGSRLNETTGWQCVRCIEQIKQIRNEFINVRTSINSNNSTDGLPYNLEMLNWDELHRRNDENIYCYCGEKGKWYMQMLQCARCLQWFHAKCIKSLNYPLYFGDRFYLFVCLGCNHGSEYIRRLKMSIEEIVHLMLFNLNVHYGKYYFSLTNIILPYIRDNWNLLQLSSKLKVMMSNDVREEITKALRSNQKRFKAGREVKKKVLTWALRTIEPPQAPNIALPSGPQLTEKYIKELFSVHARIQFLPNNNTNEVTISNDMKAQNTMYGRNYSSFVEDCEIDSTDSDTNKHIVITASDDEYIADSTSSSQTNNDDFIQCDNSLTGYEFLNGNNKKIGVRVPEVRKRGRPCKNERPNDSSGWEIHDSSDDTSSRGTLDSIIPPLKDFSGSNNPFLIDNSSSSSASSKSSSLNFTNSINFDHKMRMIRTIKRQLSAKDIVIGPNMEVKRRKLIKRRRGFVETTKTMTYILPQKDTPSTSKETKTNEIADKSLPTTQNGLPLASTSDISSVGKDEMKSPADWYFGSVADRIAKGGKFTVQGKRILVDGRLQFLIDWDGAH